ncbi:uncharacterized protein LOC124641686 isoform X1 [Helicoverpa zea]|uniref:uncharacterized protein LOC124641686 isoform X1 n=1 Tax=Helicoverpa zea TaxID=7113 RepID=UPI001F5A3D9C|nr:uncharacterized protein LOC124641686 isoform X1 [Helicoverpa zea]
MLCEVVVRAATPRDLSARAELVRACITEYDFDAFLMFFFQELTLQVCVLCGAVLFIFAGASLAACALVLPAAAAAAALAACLAHRASAAAHHQRMRAELCGFVAEYRGPLCSAPPGHVRVRQAETECGAGGALVGSLSVAECWGPRRSGWVQALGVARAWRRRGVGAALLWAARRWAAAEGLESLETCASELQGGARELLHADGWQVRSTTQRPVLGAALTLGVAQLGLELPHA